VGPIASAPLAPAPNRRIAVVIPCLDEASTIAKVVRDFAGALPDARVLVFDNDSTDGSAELARQAGAEVILSPLRGKGNVLRHVWDVVDADVFFLVDGDDTYPASAAPALLERFERDRLDLLIAARLEGSTHDAFRTFHRLGNRMISKLTSVLFQTHLTDVLSGYRVLSRSLVDVVRLRTQAFEVETEMTLQALSKRFAVGEMPVDYAARPTGSFSKLSTWSDGFLILRSIFLLFRDYKPLVFFTGLSGVLAFASLVAGSAPVRDFVATGYVLHIPRAILAAGLGVLAVVCLTAGITLGTIARLHGETIELWKRHLAERPGRR
jgi:glycosyltransferase involved in cell wall biosynthesis